MFAPVDDAFAKIDAATLDTLKTDSAMLSKILTYHSPVPVLRLRRVSARETTGLKCAPETGASSRIRTPRPSAVAIEFSSSCRPGSVERRSAAIPDPTTTVTSSPVPRNSARLRRQSESRLTAGEP